MKVTNNELIELIKLNKKIKELQARKKVIETAIKDAEIVNTKDYMAVVEVSRQERIAGLKAVLEVFDRKDFEKAGLIKTVDTKRIVINKK